MCPKPTYLTLYENDLETLKEIADYYIKFNNIKQNPKEKLTTYQEFQIALDFAKFWMEDLFREDNTSGL